MVQSTKPSKTTTMPNSLSSRLTVTPNGEEVRVKAGLKRTYDIFALSHKYPLPPLVLSKPAHEIKVLSKVIAEYKHVRDIDTDAQIIQDAKIAVSLPSKEKNNAKPEKDQIVGADSESVGVKPSDTDNVLDRFDVEEKKRRDTNPNPTASPNLDDRGGELVAYKKIGMPELEKPKTRALQIRENITRQRGNFDNIKPKWHAPWKLFRVISGHLGWVQSIAVDPTNQFFVTGSADRTIKVWDVASGTRKLTLTGHVNTVRGLAISDRHPYMFSASEDKSVKCWDLEHNRIIRHYHGHLSGVYSLVIHPTLDLIISGGRDSAARVWDMRTSKEVMILGGHTNTVSSLIAQDYNPQVVTGSMDSTIRLWDLAAGKPMTTLTNHKKGVRALVRHPREFTFCSAAADVMKKWHCKEGRFLQNLPGHKGIVNTLAVNQDSVMVSGGDDGSIKFWDYESGHCYDTTQTIVQPGSLESEASILASTFDITGTRLFTCEGDKTIKVWKEDPDATEDTHPLDWTPTERATDVY